MPLKRPWQSLKTRLTLVTTLVWLVSLWALALSVGWSQRSELEANFGNSQHVAAAVIADLVGHQLNDRIESLKAIARMVTPELLKDKLALQQFLDTRPSLMVLFNGGGYITGLEGVALASIPAAAGRVGIRYLERPHVLKALTENSVALSDIVVGAALKTPVFSIAVPVDDETGNVKGCLVGVIDLSKPNFLNYLDQSSLGGATGYLLITRSQRLIITSSDRSRTMEQLPPKGVNPGIDAFLEGANGSRVLVTPKGVEVLASVEHIPIANWYVALNTPTHEVFAPIRVLQDRMLVFVFVLTLLTGAANWILLRRQLLPVVTTIDKLAQMAEPGRKFEPLPVPRTNEIGNLIEALNLLLQERERRDAERIQLEALISQNQRMEALGLLAGGIAHDFNNLLAAIFGNMELALVKDKNGPASPYLVKTLETLGRARNLTQQLMTFSKGGHPELRSGPPFPFVEETARFALSGSTVRLEIHAAADLWPCRYDHNQIGQVIDNLVINAVQAMPQGGKIRITAANRVDAEQRRWIDLSVTDSGSGMTAETRDRLFEPFYTTKELGHGLGLTTCYSIVTKHGGSIRVESELGQGTTFHVSLPAAEEVVAAKPAHASEGHRGHGSLLVLEDDAAIGQILEEMLVSLGYGVVRVATGQEALNAFEADRKGPQSLVGAILDLTIRGGLGGQEVLAGVRTLDDKFPVMVASGYSEAPVLANPSAHGFRAAIKKPYLREELVAALNLLW